MNSGKKLTAILFLGVLFFGVASAAAAAAAAKKLDVHKTVENAGDIRAGDEVTILLTFKNPFTQAIPVQIVDKNVFGNNGLDIQCLEYTLPAKKEAAIAYEPIVPFKAGEYTLSAAKITYTNPDTGNQETVESNTLRIEVKNNGTIPPGQQGITTIYRCGGTSIQSTSYSSSSSSVNIHIGEQQSSSPQEQPQSLEQRVANNQLNQNSGQLKKELEQEMQKQKALEEQIRKELANNSDFQSYDAQLRGAGLNQTPPSFNPVSQNHTKITVPYRNESVERRINADYINGTIQNVTLERPPEKKAGRWLLLLIPLAGAVAAAGWFILDNYMKRAKKEELLPVAVNSLQTVDYVADARRMVEEGTYLFKKKREKDAYEKISQAIRFYFAYKLGINKVLLNTELITTLREKGNPDTSKVKKCLDLCGQVEFATYKTSDKDFYAIVEIAKEIIV